MEITQILVFHVPCSALNGVPMHIMLEFFTLLEPLAIAGGPRRHPMKQITKSVRGAG
jgi:hypothetical protein